MPSRLRPKAPIARDAVLVGDPGRALLLAQELLEEPKMSNHARGLWGYSGRSVAGGDLTVQATGIGGPSAAIVVSDLAKLGVRRAIRVGSCRGAGDEAWAERLLVVDGAVAEGGSGAAFGLSQGQAAVPDPHLLARLREELPGARSGRIASIDLDPEQASPAAFGVTALDMQTVAVLATARRLGLAAAAVLIVAEVEGLDGQLDDEALEVAAKRAGTAALAVLSP